MGQAEAASPLTCDGDSWVHLAFAVGVALTLTYFTYVMSMYYKVSCVCGAKLGSGTALKAVD